MIETVCTMARLASFLERLRHLSWRKIKAHTQRIFYFETEECIYRITPAEALKFPQDPEIRRDRWEDLATYVPAEPGDELEPKLKEWKRRLASNQHVYTKMEDGKLAIYGWMIERQKISRLDELKQDVELPPNCAVVYDFYCLPQYRNRHYYPRMLMHVLHEAAEVPGTEWIHVGVTRSNKVPYWWVNRLRLTHRESYFYRRVGWKEKKWRQTIATSPEP
ncbi:MAG TPA: hypothetical protein VFB14_17255 [Bryobacteraceae bacterium]|jgi:hypothetical protein|nr:hypothetical protein [Bryobacteraceae bacterium]